jgi:hypothetical protein
MDSSPSQRHRDVPKWEKNDHLTESEESKMNVTTIGLDIAKSVFQGMAATRAARRLSANNLSAPKCLRILPTCPRV